MSVSCPLAPNTEGIASGDDFLSFLLSFCFLTSLAPTVSVEFHPPLVSLYLGSDTAFATAAFGTYFSFGVHSTLFPLATTRSLTLSWTSHALKGLPIALPPRHVRGDICARTVLPRHSASSHASHAPSRPSPSPCSRSPSPWLPFASANGLNRSQSTPVNSQIVSTIPRRCQRSLHLRRVHPYLSFGLSARAHGLPGSADRRYADTRSVDSIELTYWHRY